MEKNQKGQVRQMKELQGRVERLRNENDQLGAHIEKSLKDAQDNGYDVEPIARDKGKGPVVPNDVDTLANDELYSCSSPSLNLLLAKNTWERTKTRSRKMHFPHPAFSDVASGASCKARREASRR